MRYKVDALIPFMRNKAQGPILAHLLFSLEAQSVTAVATAIDIPRKTVSDEVARLENSGVVNCDIEGRNKLIYLNKNHLLHKPLSQMLQLMYGPYELLRSNIEEISEIATKLEELYIYGSWARRYHGEEGLPPNDLDILAVGSVSLFERHSIVELIQEQLPLRLPYEININVVDGETWRNPKAYKTFLKNVHNRPIVKIK